MILRLYGGFGRLGGFRTLAFIIHHAFHVHAFHVLVLHFRHWAFGIPYDAHYQEDLEKKRHNPH